MASKVDLRKALTTAAPMAGIRSQLPLRPGQLADLTESERAGLEQLSWKPGDPIPGNLSDILATEQQRLASEAPPLLIDPSAPFVVPNPIRVEDLPPERQAEVARVLARAREQMRRQPVAEPFAPTGPGVAEAHRVAQRAAQTMNPSRTQSAAQQEPESVSPPGGEPNPAAVAPSLTGLEAPANCPHCGWNTKDHPDGLEPDRSDKLIFLQAVLGGKPFTKTFLLLGGQLSVTYRALGHRTADLIQNQLQREVARQEIRTAGEYFEATMTYQLCMSLATVRVANGAVTDFPEDENGYELDADDANTKLLRIKEYVAATAFPTESLRRMLGLQFARFQHVLSKLEARIDDENFWRETGSPP